MPAAAADAQHASQTAAAMAAHVHATSLSQPDLPAANGIHDPPSEAAHQQRHEGEGSPRCSLEGFPLHASSADNPNTGSPNQQTAQQQHAVQSAQPIMAQWPSPTGPPAQPRLGYRQDGQSTVPHVTAEEHSAQLGHARPADTGLQLHADLHLLRPEGPTEDVRAVRKPAALPVIHGTSSERHLQCKSSTSPATDSEERHDAVADDRLTHGTAAQHGTTAQRGTAAQYRTAGRQVTAAQPGSAAQHGTAEQYKTAAHPENAAPQKGKEQQAAQGTKASQPSSSSLKRVPETPDSAEHRSQADASPGKHLTCLLLQKQFVTFTSNWP